MSSVDAAVLQFLNQFARQSVVWDTFIATLSRADLLKGAAMMAVMLWVWFRQGGNKTSDREFVALSLFISGASVLLARALSLTFPFRERPLRDPLLHFQLPYGMDLDSLQGWSSFPSDHATFFFAAATCLLFLSRRLGIVALLYAFFVICLPRVYLGLHYPTDILGGAMIGATMALWVKLPWLRNAVGRPILRCEELHPTSFYPLFFSFTFEVAEMFDSIRGIGKLFFVVAQAATGNAPH